MSAFVSGQPTRPGNPDPRSRSESPSLAWRGFRSGRFNGGPGPPVGQLHTQRLLVDGFEETRAEGTVHLNRSTGRLVHECVQLGARLFDGPHSKSSSDADGWLRDVRVVQISC